MLRINYLHCREISIVQIWRQKSTNNSITRRAYKYKYLCTAYVRRRAACLCTRSCYCRNRITHIPKLTRRNDVNFAMWHQSKGSTTSSVPYTADLRSRCIVSFEGLKGQEIGRPRVRNKIIWQSVWFHLKPSFW